MKKILFVDDDQEILRGLRRMLRGMRDEWQMSFVASGQEALKLMGEENFDLIVSDMRMPGMDGVKLLEEVRKLYPGVVRIILSGDSGKDQVMSSIKPAHQFLAKPIEQETLLVVIYRALAMKEVMSDQGLMQLLSQVESLPSMPKIYADLLTAVESEKTSLETIGAIIEQDMGMSATILKVVNSAFFGLPRHIKKPAQAVSLLGLDVIKSLVLSYQVFSSFDIKGVKGISFNLLWEHSVNTACLAKTVAEAEKEKPELVDEAFIGGMLHDVGKLPLIALTPEKYNQVLTSVRAENRLVWDAEMEILGTSHAEVGAYLMGLWGMSEKVINALAFHHKPSSLRLKSFGTVTAVHVANVMEHELVVLNENYARPQIDSEHLAHIGKEDRLPVWREKCLSCLKTRGAKC